VQRICVYMGSSIGNRPIYQQATNELAQEMLSRKLGLVYGGGRVGLMGVLADAILAGGGEVIGVFPHCIPAEEVAHREVTTLYEVETMHERKALMADLADGFIALPGGFGTYDELFEILAWAQLGVHHKPVGLLNVANYFDPLIALINHSVEEGFLKADNADILVTKDNPGDLLGYITSKQSIFASTEALEKYNNL
jgi:uncharacterized protein (TIGR00730 family)